VFELDVLIKLNMLDARIILDVLDSFSRRVYSGFGSPK